MREVSYNRWSAWIQVVFGFTIAGAGVGGICVSSEGSKLAGLVFVLIGAIIMHVARLRLKERDVLLRLTPDKIWTKEFGWQPWDTMIISLDRRRQGYILEIHKPSEFIPRFYENISTLNIEVDELKHWFKLYSRDKK